MSTGAHNLRFIDAVDRTGLYTVMYTYKNDKNCLKLNKTSWVQMRRRVTRRLIRVHTVCIRCFSFRPGNAVNASELRGNAVNDGVRQ